MALQQQQQSFLSSEEGYRPMQKHAVVVPAAVKLFNRAE
jgi:hypothetical protein